jgi:hypothetical protein
MTHQLVTNTKRLHPGADATGARTLLKNLSGYDLILSGDNHQRFTLEHRGRRVVNPGSVFRTVADQVDHTPAVYLWSAEDNQLEKILLPTENDIILRDHLDQQEEKDRRIDDYIECMKNDYEVELDFEHNIREHIGLNEVDKKVESFIYACMEVEK